jgi:acetylornithine/succinyldiaminopimelate/putrescine aminotransferase
LLLNCTHNTVIRLLPALTVTDDQIDEGCTIVEEVLSAHGS